MKAEVHGSPLGRGSPPRLPEWNRTALGLQKEAPTSQTHTPGHNVFTCCRLCTLVFKKKKKNEGLILIYRAWHLSETRNYLFRSLFGHSDYEKHLENGTMCCA